MKTLRKQIITLLSETDMTARDLSKAVAIKEKEVCGHLPHIERSVKAVGGKLLVRPFKCLKCGFVFKERKRFTRPGKCPRCRESHLESPRYRIV